MTLRKTAPRPKERWALLMAIVAGLVLALGGMTLAVHDVDAFELDKNASNDLNVTKLGDLAANISISATSVNVCRTATSEPSTPFTILIRAERMSVTAVGAGSFGGNCGGTKSTYTVTRGFDNTTAAAQAKGGVDGIVSLLVANPGQEGPDWDQVRAAVEADPDTKCESLGLVECAFVEDGIGPTIFIGGASKDHLPIEGWQNTSGSSPDKAEILNAFAAKAEDENGDQILYFGMDRYAVDGSTDIGFWFFRGEVSVDTAAGTFSGTHQGDITPGDDDILALATFTQGGAATNIRLFRWVGTGGNESGTISGPDATAGDCLPPPPAPPTENDPMCGTVNDTTIEVPWNYTFKGAPSGGWIPTGGFFEGGINLSRLGLEGCFTGFLAETRSSPEITAILKDFAFGSFEACDTELTTTPADDGGTALEDGDDADTLPETTIGTGADGVDVTDVAELEVKGTDTWEGTLDFYLCGPIATGTCETPDGDPPVGVLIDSQEVSNADLTTTYTSASANLTEVGRYCWRGEFLSGTEGVPDAIDASEGECFEVLPVTPALSTQAVGPTGTPLDGAVPFGDPLYDLATLVGTAHQPGTDGDGDVNGDYTSINATMDTPADGTITFELRGPDGATLDCTTVATGTGDNPEDVTVSGDDDYMSSGFTPDQPGDYHWVASYDGDSPNTNGTTHNTDCLDDDEDVTVQQLQPTLSTAQTFIPNDAATVSVAGGAGDLDGDVTFYLWIDDPTCGDDDPLTADKSFGPIPVFAEDDGSDPLTDTAATNNAVAYGDDGTDFYWMVVFESTTGSHLDVVGTCGNENSSITIDNGVTEPASP